MGLKNSVFSEVIVKKKRLYKVLVKAAQKQSIANRTTEVDE